MSVAGRSLLLLVPLLVAALAGLWYTPKPLDQAALRDIATRGLPPLPKWAAAELPDFAAIRDITEKKAAFFSFLYPRIELANSRILIERAYLESLAGRDKLTSSQVRWLEAQAERLRVDEEPGSPELFARLLKRLDVIPPSLVMAQAANESAWGTSRFATEGNNLFGQWCFSKGCGLVPQSRVEGASHEVARFASPYQSVQAYIQNLNRHQTYQALRDIREKDRNNGEFPDGNALAGGLIGYSERGEDYVKEIRAMIGHNNLGYYDRKFADSGRKSE